MISDTLFDAVQEIDEYLDTFQETYTGDLRSRIVKLRDAMDALRVELDAPQRHLTDYQMDAHRMSGCRCQACVNTPPLTAPA